MGYDIGEGEAPLADVGSDKDRNNPDTYEEDDDNGNATVQV